MRIVGLMIGMLFVGQSGCSSQQKAEQRQESSASGGITKVAEKRNGATECGTLANGKIVYRYDMQDPRATILSTSTNFPEEVADLVPIRKRKLQIPKGAAALITITDGWIYVIGEHVPVGANTTVAVADGSSFILDASGADERRPRVMHRTGQKAARTWIAGDETSERTVPVKHETRRGNRNVFLPPVETRDPDGVVAQVRAAAEQCGVAPPD